MYIGPPPRLAPHFGQQQKSFLGSCDVILGAGIEQSYLGLPQTSQTSPLKQIPNPKRGINQRSYVACVLGAWFGAARRSSMTTTMLRPERLCCIFGDWTLPGARIWGLPKPR